MIHIVVYQVLLSSQFKLDGVLLAWQTDISTFVCIIFNLFRTIKTKQSEKVQSNET